MDPVTLREELRPLLEPTVQRLGFELVAIEWVGSRRGRVLRLSIDAPSGVDAHHCARVSSMLSPVLDEADPIAGRYVLEVSSPGMKRPVQREQDFARFAGHRIRIRLVEGPARRRFNGELRGIEDGDVLIETEGVLHRLDYQSVEDAHLVLTLEEYQALSEEDHDHQ